MANKCKRFLSLLLAMVMVIGMMPAGYVHAEEETFPVITDKVTSVENNATYVICIAGTKNALSNQQGSRAWGTHTLATIGCDKVANDSILWTLEPAAGGYKLKNVNGYLTISRNTASLNETGHVFELKYADGVWTIKSLETNEYGNNLGDSGNIGGWSGDGTKFDLYTVAETPASVVDPFGKLRGYWKEVSVDSETVYDSEQGLFKYAFDSNTRTIWHSNWQGASDKLNGSNTFAGVIDFGEAYLIDQFSFTPRVANNSGRVTQASLYVKETEDAEWTLVVEHATFEANGDKKDMNFDAQPVRFVKFVAEQSNDGWVAVSEFDVACKHTHDYEESITTAATCTTAGVKTFTCVCSAAYTSSYTEEIVALGHKWADADCTTPKTCSVCGATEGEALGHDWNDADCTNPKTCTVCGATEGAALGHDWNDADCTNPKTCTVCGATEGEALGHTWADANCTTPKTCTVCGATEGEALGHTNGTPVKEKEVAPTFTTAGSYDMVVYCTVCGAEVSRETETIPALISVAEINGVKYATLQDAFDAVKHMETITLLVDVELDTYLNVNNPGVFALDLNGHNIKRPYEIGSGNTGIVAIYVNGEDTCLDIYGEGSVTAELAVWAASGMVVIEDGKFHGYTDTIYTSGTGYIEIWGGEFSAEETTHTQNKYSVLNKKDGSDSKIVVVGGSFIGFNPANNYSEGAGTNFVAEGYCSTFAEGFWTVNAHDWNDADCDTPKTCSICGATEGEALGHAWTATAYENKGENHITTYTCGNDATHTYSEAEAHTYVNGRCVCGAEEIEVVYVAKIGEQGYETLANAIAAVKNGETIVLLDDCAENVTIKQVADKSFTIDGNGKTYTGTITIDGNKRSTGKETLTIQNVKFVRNGGSSIVGNKNTHVHNLTVDGCYFEGADYGMSMRHTYNITVKNTTAKNMSYGLYYAPLGVSGLTVENVTITESTAGFRLDYLNKPVSFKNVNLNVTDTGVRVVNYTKGTVSFDNCAIAAATPVELYLAHASNVVTLDFNGTNTIADNWLKITGTGADVIVDLTDDANLDISNVIYDETYYGVKTAEKVHTITELPAVAAINGTEYKSIQAAVEAAVDGDTVVLLTNVELGWNDVVTNADGYTTLVDVVGKSIILDLAGYTISVDHQSDTDRIYSVICVEDGASLTVTGNGGIDVDVNDETPKVAYMFWKRGTTGTMVIENGSYHMDNSEDSMVYTNGSEIVTVKGGTFTLDTVGTRVNGFPWTFNTAGNNQRNIVVIGGTYNYDITNQYWKYEVNIPEGYACEDNGNGTWSVVEDNSIAQNLQTGEKFETLAEAIAAVKNGETIVMLADCDENVTIKQTAGKSFTIDGNGKTYTGTITVDGNRRSTGTETLTIKNFNFVLNGQWQSSILASKNTYVHNLTIDGCTFTGTDAHEAYGIRLYSAYDVTVKNTTGTKLYDLVYAQTMTEGFTAENIVVTDSGMGFFMPYAKGNVSFKNVQLQTSGACVGFYNNNVYTATFENCIFDSDSAIWVDHSKTTSNVGKLIFKGGNDFGDGAWLNVAGQGTDVIVDLTGSDLDISKVTFDKTYYGVETVEKVHTITELPAVAAVNGTEYKSIQAAVEAAQDGDTVVLLVDIVLTEDDVISAGNYNAMVNVDGKDIILDMNGMTINVDYAGENLLYAVIRVADGAGLTVTGNGTIDVKQEGTIVSGSSELPNVAYMFWMNGTTGHLTIENGNYHMNDAADSIVYSNGNEIVNIKGGNFTMDAAGTRANGFPWIFNTQGQNEKAIVVTGGTYNVDIGGQFWSGEVYIPDGYICAPIAENRWEVRVGKWIAQNQETSVRYESLAEAIAAVKNGETVVLLDDCAEDVTIKQTSGKSFTIDGNGKTYSGTITVDGSRRYNGTETLTIKNVIFVSEEQSHIFIDASNSTYAHNITVDGCSFTGDGSAYGMKLSQVYNITVKNTTGTKLFDLVYGNKAVNGLTVENVEISDSSNGFMLSYVNGTATFKNVTIDAINDGVIIRNNAAGTVTFEDCSIDNITYWPTANNAKAVSMIFNDTVNTLDIAGEHTMLTAVLNQADATITAVEGLNVIPSEELAKSYEVVYENGVYRLSHAIARNEATGKLYMDLSDALAEAADGQTVTLLKETAEDLVLVPAGVNFDLNGNVVTAGNVLSFGIVKDTAANVGGIMISNNTEVAFTKLQPENGGYLPVYDTRDGMYKFFAYELTNADGIKLVGNSVKFGIKLSFENEAAFEVMANTDDSGITMSADVTWTGMNVPNVNFKLDKALTVEYALKKAANPSKNYAITLTIGGLDNLQTGDFIRVTPILTTNTEVGCRINTNEYIKD